MILDVIKGSDIGQRWTLDGDFTIGRDRACEVTLRDERVSRHHARVRRLNGEWVVDDLGSANGTWVNRRRLDGPYALQSGDEVGVGRTVMAVQISQPVAVVAPPASAPAEVSTTQPRAYRASPFALLLDGFLALASLLLVVGAPLPWIKLPVLWQTVTFLGTDGLGVYTLIGGGVTLVLALALLLLRLALRQAAPAAVSPPTWRAMRAYLRWGGAGPLVIGLALLSLLGTQWWRYTRGANAEIFLGIALSDLVDPRPAIGLILTGVGLLALFFGSIAHLAVLGFVNLERR